MSKKKIIKLIKRVIKSKKGVPRKGVQKGGKKIMPENTETPKAEKGSVKEQNINALKKNQAEQIKQAKTKEERSDLEKSHAEQLKQVQK